MAQSLRPTFCLDFAKLKGWPQDKNWLSSDYYLTALQYDPASMGD
jgi:hypothetical protein